MHNAEAREGVCNGAHAQLVYRHDIMFVLAVSISECVEVDRMRRNAQTIATSAAADQSGRRDDALARLLIVLKQIHTLTRWIAAAAATTNCHAIGSERSSRSVRT
jgi:hypothetical protein